MWSLGEEEKKNNERKQNEKQPRGKKKGSEIEGRRDRGGGKMQKGHKAERERERGRKIMKALKDRSVSAEIYSKKMRGATSC